MTANASFSWYLPLTRLISEPAEAFTPAGFLKKQYVSQSFFVLRHHVLLVLNVLMTSTWFSVVVKDILAVHDRVKSMQENEKKKYPIQHRRRAMYEIA